MISDLKPYPAYKDSGAPWLGSVPEHWDVPRVKQLFRYRKELNAQGLEDNILSLTLRGVVNNDPENPEGLVPKDYRTYQLFEKNNLVFKLIDLENLRTSRVGLVHERGIMSSAYVRLIPPSDGNLHFHYHQFFDLYTRGIYNQLGAGVRSTLGPNDLLNVRVVSPPVEEQRLIARFLAHAERRIGRYVRAKQKLIKLLEEQKQAIIHRAVTRGLDPNVRLKPSGVEWLGDIPEHWRAERAKFHFREVDERSTTGKEELLSVSHKTGVTPRSEKNITMFMAASYVGHKLCRPNDVVVNTMWAWMAAIGVARRTGIVSSSYGVYRAKDLSNFDPDFLDLLLRTESYRNEYLRQSRGITTSRLRLYPEQFLGIPMIIPPASEQYEIVEWVNENTRMLEATLSSANREIALLREYRTRLIADVVTGKLDVREAAARLPDEAEEAPEEIAGEALDDENDEDLVETEEEAA